MADRYLLESGAPDGYQLEDGSGVLLLDVAAVFDAASANFVENDSILTFNHTCSGSNRVLIVDVAVGNSPDSMTCGVTYNGVAMTSLAKKHSNENTAGYIEKFILINPASGSNSVVVTLTGAATTLIAGGKSYNGASQTLADYTGSVVSASGADATPTVNVTGTALDSIVDDGSCNGNAFTAVGAGQTQRWDVPVNNNTAAGNARGSTEPGNGGTVTMSYTVTSDWWAIIAVEIPVVAESAGTPVGQDLAFSYNTKAPIGDNLAFSYHTRTPVFDTQAFSYHTRVAIGDTQAFSHHTRAAAGDEQAFSYNTRAVASDELQFRYHVLVGVPVGDDLTFSYNVRIAVSDTLPLSYNIKAAINDTLAFSYHVRDAVDDSLSFIYHTRGAVSDELSLLYNTRVPIFDTLAFTYHAHGATGDELQFSYLVRANVGDELPFSYHTLVIGPPPVTKDFAFTYHVRAPATDSLSLLYNTRVPSSDELSFTYNVRVPASDELVVTWNVRIPVNDLLSFTYNILTTTSDDLAFTYRVRELVFDELQFIYDLLSNVPDSVPGPGPGTADVVPGGSALISSVIGDATISGGPSTATLGGTGGGAEIV